MQSRSHSAPLRRWYLAGLRGSFHRALHDYEITKVSGQVDVTGCNNYLEADMITITIARASLNEMLGSGRITELEFSILSDSAERTANRGDLSWSDKCAAYAEICGI